MGLASPLVHVVVSLPQRTSAAASVGPQNIHVVLSQFPPFVAVQVYVFMCTLMVFRLFVMRYLVRFDLGTRVFLHLSFAFHAASV